MPRATSKKPKRKRLSTCRPIAAPATVSQFLNDLFLRKAFSWTRVFEDLERVMPPRLHVVSIHPATNTDNQLEDQDGGGGRIARPRDRTGAQDGEFATLPADSNRAGIKPGPDRRRATTCNLISAPMYSATNGGATGQASAPVMADDSREAREKGEDCDCRPAGGGHPRRGAPVFSAGGIGAIAPRTTGPVVAGTAAQDARG